MNTCSLVIITFEEERFKKEIDEAGIHYQDLIFSYPNSSTQAVEDIKSYRPRLVIIDSSLHDALLERHLSESEGTKWDHDIHLDKAIVGKPGKKYPGVYQCSTIAELKTLLDTL